MRNYLVLFSAFLTIVVIVVSALFYQAYDKSTLNETTINIQVKKGSTLYSNCQRWAQDGLVQTCFDFKLIRLMLGEGVIKAGTYQIKPFTLLPDFYEMLMEGKEHLFSLTLVEGKNVTQFLETLKAHPHIIYDLENTSLDAVSKIIHQPNPEGWLLPETYRFSTETKASTIILQAYQLMEEKLEEIWLTRPAETPLKSAYDALILASIVEKETGQASERPVISGVFHNRLKKKMRLQTDPTVIYGIGPSFDGNITRAHLRQKTPYNTYVIKGLPPTPIANPGAEAIQAAVHPAKVKYLFFVSKGNGTHQFSATLKEHNKAVNQYQRKK
ncbi:endolytic transglycosylase MltG [Algicola sagamiensis]|uniref:endolytic transglycosylase MltG n=1 Tax=Algicola sagamiensis TaxID=163869 RepID=UPI00036B743D|nr:endolytic transglycosylase MltG [Algicola sagamiensis]